jgi:hypothetical protein
MEKLRARKFMETHSRLHSYECYRLVLGQFEFLESGNGSGSSISTFIGCRPIWVPTAQEMNSTFLTPHLSPVRSWFPLTLPEVLL